jgi:hypothetical protein
MSGRGAFHSMGLPNICRSNKLTTKTIEWIFALQIVHQIGELNVLVVSPTPLASQQPSSLLPFLGPERRRRTKKERISGHVVYPAASWTGNALCAALMATGKISEDAVVAVEAREPSYGL